jgi:hypothetical protein
VKILNGESRIIMLIITGLIGLCFFSLWKWNEATTVGIITCFTGIATMAVTNHYQLKRYEIERGTLEGDIEEEWGFRFYVPISRKIPDGVVACEFRTRPVPRHAMHIDDLQPRLRLVR